ncbi:hypothetical protein ACJMK2_008548 [Sinanodonta woodiana]|uniref:Uncharacterized protein n=1 Tax=Sinanodonta woodiana TaxID=1069815 RepID=A0ABD3VMR6_SINWO
MITLCQQSRHLCVPLNGQTAILQIRLGKEGLDFITDLIYVVWGYHTLARNLVSYHQWLSVPNTKVRYGAHTETVNILVIFTAFGILLMSSLIAYILSDTNDNPDLFEVSALPLLLGSLISAVSTFIITSGIELQMHFIACREKKVGPVYSMVRKGLGLQKGSKDNFYCEALSVYPPTQEACFIDLEETASTVSGYGRLLSLWNNLDWINVKKRITKSFSGLLMGKKVADFARQDSLRTLYKSCVDIDEDYINEMRNRHRHKFVPSHAKYIYELLWKHFPDTDTSQDITKKQEESFPSHSRETMEEKLSQKQGSLYKPCIDLVTSKDSIARKYKQPYKRPLSYKPRHANAEAYNFDMDVGKSKEEIANKHEWSVSSKRKLFQSDMEIDASKTDITKKHQQLGSSQSKPADEKTSKFDINIGAHKDETRTKHEHSILSLQQAKLKPYNSVIEMKISDKSELTSGLGVRESSLTDRPTLQEKHELSIFDKLQLEQQSPFKSCTEIDMPQEEFKKKKQQYASAQLTHTNNVTFKSVIDLPGGIHKSKSDLEISSSDYLSLDFEVTVGRIVIADKDKHGQKSKEEVYLDDFTGHRGTDLLTYIEEVASKQKKLIDRDSDLSDSSLDEISEEITNNSDEMGTSSSHVFVSLPRSLSEESLSTDCFNTRSSQYVINIPSPFWEMCSNTDVYPAVTSQTERFQFDNAHGAYLVPESYSENVDSATSDAQLFSQRNKQSGRENKVAQDSYPLFAGHGISGVSRDDLKHRFLEPVFYKINLTSGLPPNQKHIDVVVKKTREKPNVGKSRSISDLADESIRTHLKPDVNIFHELDQLLQSMRNAIKIGITWSHISVFEKQRDLQLWSRSYIEAMNCTLKNFKKQAEGGNLLFSSAFDQGKCFFKNYLVQLCVVLGWDLKKNPECVWQDLEKNMSRVFAMASEAVCNTLKGTCQLLLHKDKVTLADLLLKSHEVMTGIEANSRSILSVERNFSGALVKPDLSSTLDNTYRTIAHTIFIEAVRLGFCEQRVPWNLFLKIFRKKQTEIFEEYVRKITSLLIYSSETIVKEYDGENFLIKALCCYITRLAKEELWKEYQDVQLVLTDVLFKQTTLDVLKTLAKTTSLSICKQVEQLLRQRWIIQGYDPSKRGEIALAQALLCAREMGESAHETNLNNNKDIFEASCSIDNESGQHAKLFTYLQFKRVETRLANCLLALVQLKTNDLVINCLQEYVTQQLSGFNKKQATGAQMDNWKKDFISFLAESISVKLNLEEEEFARRDHCRRLLDAVLETESLQHDLFMQSTVPLKERKQRIKTSSIKETDKIEKVDEEMLSQRSDNIERTCITEMINELKPVRKYLKFVGMIESIRGQITKENYVARIRKEQELFVQIQLQNVVDSFYILNDEEMTPKIDRTTLYQLEYDTMGDRWKHVCYILLPRAHFLTTDPLKEIN